MNMKSKGSFVALQVQKKVLRMLKKKLLTRIFKIKSFADKKYIKNALTNKIIIIHKMEKGRTATLL